MAISDAVWGQEPQCDVVGWEGPAQGSIQAADLMVVVTGNTNGVTHFLTRNRGSYLGYF